MAQLATIANENEATGADPKTRAVLDLVRQQQQAISIALPRHITSERFTRIVLTEVRRNPSLLRCDPMSLLGSIMLAAQLGLEPGPLGHCYFVPFKREVTFILGYKGMIDLARRSGQVSTIVARAVHEGDDFSYRYGLDDDLAHVPSEEPGELTHVYAIAKFKDGGSVFVVLSRVEVEGFRARSSAERSGRNSPWKTDYEAMAKKTAIRRLFPFLPVTPELAAVLSVADETPVHGISADILADLELTAGQDEPKDNEADDGDVEEAELVLEEG